MRAVDEYVMVYDKAICENIDDLEYKAASNCIRESQEKGIGFYLLNVI